MASASRPNLRYLLPTLGNVVPHGFQTLSAIRARSANHPPRSFCMSIETGTSAGAFDSTESTITACLERLMSSDELREWEPSGPPSDDLLPLLARRSASQKNELEELPKQPVREIAAKGQLLQEYLTPSELAAELRKTVRTLDRWQLQGRGPAFTYVGKSKMYRRSAVMEWLRRSETSPNPRRRIM